MLERIWKQKTERINNLFSYEETFIIYYNNKILNFLSTVRLHIKHTFLHFKEGITAYSNVRCLFCNFLLHISMSVISIYCFHNISNSKWSLAFSRKFSYKYKLLSCRRWIYKCLHPSSKTASIINEIRGLRH